MTGRKLAPPSLRGYFPAVFLWTGGLVSLALARQVISGLLGRGDWDPIQLLLNLPGWIGVLLPFSSYAGGLGAASRVVTRPLLQRALVLALLTYSLLAFVAPICSYEGRKRSSGDVELVYPFGPRTPFGVLAHKKAVIANPPEAYSFRASQPMALPPNRLTYSLHVDVAWAIFAFLSALLGHLVAAATSGLSPPTRKNVGWAVGLGNGGVFYVLMAWGSSWVRGDPSVPGVLGAWPPLLTPLFVLLVFSWLNRSSRPSRSSPGGGEGG